MPPSLLSGHLVAGRYRIVELVGVGRTAEVYRAEDLSLNRTVAVKVLLERLAAYEDVRRAFRDRIVRSAALSHPHLARVFDGGQESGVIFMISEFLSGGSFEDVVVAGRTLSADDGARLGRDVASALSYLHQNNFVHGELAPSKLLFDAEGHVRVSDVALAGLAEGHRDHFGIDDARYLSPEQALGDPPDAKSDVYALALIIFEAVTGEVAFDGENAEGVLRARLNAPLPVRADLGSLDMILAQATVPDIRLRLDANQFMNRLGGVVGDSSPLIITQPRGQRGLLAQFGNTDDATTPRSIGFRPPSPDQISMAPSSAARWSSTRSAPPLRPPTPPTPIPRRGRWGWVVAALVLLLVAGGAGAAWRAGLFTQTHVVPTIIDLTPAQASTALQSDGYTLTVTSKVHSAHVRSGFIVSQSPVAGSSAKANSVISVVVSDGPVMVTLPTNIVGVDCATATANLAKVRVNAQCPVSASIFSTRQPAGRVARVLYHSTVNPVAVPVRSTVILSLSKGKNPATTTTSSVTSTTNSSNATTPSSTTTTTVATVQGHAPRRVPNVVGMNQSQVYAAFHQAQLYYSTTGPNAGTSKWTSVVSEQPSAGTLVTWHSSVTLRVH